MKRLIYGCLLALIAGMVAWGYFSSLDGPNHSRLEEKRPVADAKVDSKNPQSEVPFVHAFEAVAMPDGPSVRDAILSQSIVGNGQGGCGFEYVAQTGGKKEPLQFYVHNTGRQELSVRLTSPSGYKWVEVTVAPGGIYGGETQWGSEQAGNWSIDLNNADGSVIKADLALLRTDSLAG